MYSKVLGLAPDGALYYRTVTPSGRLYLGEIDLETGRVLVQPAPVATRYTGLPSMPAWSPDGKYLLYLALRFAIGLGDNVLTIRSAATGEERFLSPRLRHVWNIAWAPDRRSVLAAGMTETETGMFRIDAETGGLTRLAEGGHAPQTLPGRQDPGLRRGGSVFLKRNLETGEESEVANAAARVYEDLSPDGRELLFKAGGAIKIAALDGGEPRELFRGPHWYGAQVDERRPPRHRPGSRHKTGWCTATSDIGGSRRREEHRSSWISGRGHRGLRDHPDNRRFAVSVSDRNRTELWVLENFLPTAKGAK